MFPIKASVLFCYLIMITPNTKCSPTSESDKASLAPFLNKKYELFSSDAAFENVMTALGVGLVQRKMAKLAKPVIMMTEKNGEYTITSDSVFKNIVTKFKIGEEFDDETPDGRKVKSLFVQDKNKLTQIQYGKKVTTIVREFSADEVKVTVTVDNIVSVRIYKAI